MNLRKTNRFRLKACVICIVSVCLSYSQNVFAQDKFIPINSIFASALSYNKKELAVANDKYIYLIDIKDFKIIDSIPLKHRPGFQVAEINYPRANRLLIKYGETNIYSPDIIMPRVPFQEFLQDSLFVIDISKKSVVSSLPGNVQVKANADSIIVVAENNHFQYKDDYGNMHLGSSAGGLVLFSGQTQLAVPANGIVNRIAIDPGGKVCYIGYYGFKNYTIEKRNLIDFSIIDTLVLDQTMDDLDIVFSDDNMYLAITTYSKLPHARELKNIRYFNAETLEQLIDFPKVSNFSGLIENGTIWSQVGNSILQTDLSTNDILTEIWANITPIDQIDNFYKINTDELLILGKKLLNKNEPGGVCKFSIQQNALYADFSNTSSNLDTVLFFDPSSIVLHDNTMIKGDKKFSTNHSTMLIIGESKKHVQLWDTKTRMKLYDWYFDTKVTAFLSNSGKELLLFKEFKGKNSDDFYLQKVEIETGKIISKLYKNNPYPFISPDSGSECVESAYLPGNWIYNEWVSGEIWNINLNNFEITLLISAKKEGFDVCKTHSLKPVPNTSHCLIDISYGNLTSSYGFDAKYDDTQSGYYILNVEKKELTKLNIPNQLRHLLPVSASLCIGIDKDNTSLHFYDLDSQKSISVNKMDLPFSTKEKTPKLFFDQTSAYCVFENNSTLHVSQYDLKSLKMKNQFKFEGSLNETILVKNTFLTKRYDSKSSNHLLTSIVLPNCQSINWELSAKKNIFHHSIELSDHFLFTNKNQLSELKKLDVVHSENIKSFSEFELLHTQKLLLLINTITYVNKGENKEFWVEAYDLYNPDSLVWSSNRMNYDDRFYTNSLNINKDESYALITFRLFGDYCNDVFVLDLETRILKNYKIPFKIMNTNVVDQDFFYVQEANQKVTDNFWNGKKLIPVYYEFKTGKKLTTEESKRLQENTHLVQIKSENLEFQGKSYFARDYLSNAKYLEEHNCLIAIGSKLHFWKIGQATPYQSIQLGNGNLKTFTTNAGRLYVIAGDGTIYIVDLENHELLLTLNTVYQNGVAYLASYTPSGYFKAPKHIIKDFHFVKNGKIYPLLNYELFLNRPDIVLSKLDFTDSRTIELYKAAHIKRLNRNGFSEQTNFFDLVVPEVHIINNIPEIADKDTVHLMLSFSNDADSYSVYVNGVPTSKDKPIDPKTNTSVVLLHHGSNTISVIAKSKNGIESDPTFLKIYHENLNYEPKIHYIGFGVSDYADTSWNLQYADDDVRSLTHFLKQGYYIKSETRIDTLVNQNATKENYLSLKKKLLTTNVNDIVLVSFSGHGMLDEDKNFYFATHDIDFKNPQEKGLSYDEILSLLDEIPARKKILLLDACHSGEADEENKRNWAITRTEFDSKDKKGAGVVNSEKQDHEAESSFELMQMSFQNLDRGNGTFVISASGAKEYAFENSGNGIFTASFMNSIREWKLKNSGNMSISELQSQVYKSVIKASNGQQKPTSRAENIEWDWVLE